MEQTNQIQTKSKKIKLDFKDSKYATGRRKRSIAKVWVKKGSGNIHVNNNTIIYTHIEHATNSQGVPITSILYYIL